MPNVSFYGLLIVAVVAFAAPLLLGLSPARRLPAVVLEIVAGIIIGPSGFGWVKVDVPTSILSLLGLAFLLFLAGLEVELDRLKGRILLIVGASFLLSFGLALLVGYGLSTGGLVKSPLLVAIILCATSLGVVSPVLKDAGESESNFGQLVIAGATIADFGSIILLSLFFSREIHPLLWRPETFGLTHQLFVSNRADVAQRSGIRKKRACQSGITEEHVQRRKAK